MEIGHHQADKGVTQLLGIVGVTLLERGGQRQNINNLVLGTGERNGKDDRPPRAHRV